MQIDFEATRHNMRLIRWSRYAAERGVSLQTMDRVLRGTYPYPTAPTYLKIIEILRNDGFLVEVPDSDDGKLAA